MDGIILLFSACLQTPDTMSRLPHDFESRIFFAPVVLFTYLLINA